MENLVKNSSNVFLLYLLSDILVISILNTEKDLEKTIIKLVKSSNY